MKSKILFCGLLMSFSAFFVSCSEDSSSNSETSTLQLKGDPPSGNVKTVWTIGRKSRNCDGIGICSYKKTVVTVEGVSVDLSKLKEEKVTFTYTYVPQPMSQGPKSLREKMRIDFEDTSLQYVDEVFGGYQIIMEEDTTFDTSEIADMPATFTVAAGTYSLDISPETGLYGVTFENIN